MDHSVVSLNLKHAFFNFIYYDLLFYLAFFLFIYSFQGSGLIYAHCKILINEIYIFFVAQITEEFKKKKIS